MEQQKKRNFMKDNRQFAVFALAIVLMLFLSGCAGLQRVDGFFQNQEYLQHSKTIDFSLFFVMFFALTYIGLSKVWGEGFAKPGGAKGAIVGLSIALSLSLAFALVTQTQFSLTTIFPMAKAIFFLIITFLLGGLIIHSKVFGEGKMGKFIAILIALIGTYLIFCIGTHMMCQMANNMDNPACQSDFFNALFNILGRWFNIDSWASSGGGGYWATSSSGPSITSSGSGGGGGGGGGGSTPGGPQGTTTTTTTTTTGGSIKGGCRLDITFEVNSPTKYTSGSPFSEYIKRVKGMGKDKVYVYGFASKEGGERYNFGLAGNRASTVKSVMKTGGLSTNMISSQGPVSTFDLSSYPPNRRVIITTEPISGGSDFMPAPGPGSLHNCPDVGETVCGDNVKKGKEQCDGNDDKDCPKACKSDCTCPGGDKDGGFDYKNLLWLLLLLIPLLIWLLLRKKKADPKGMNVIKTRFMTTLQAIIRKKEEIWQKIMTFDHTRMDPRQLEIRAAEHIKEIEDELAAKWISLFELAKRYSGAKWWKRNRLHMIEEYARKFDINEQHAKQIARIMQAVGYNTNDTEYTFKDRVRKHIISEMQNRNRVMKESHQFFVEQEKLKKETTKFLEKEIEFLKKVQKEDNTTQIDAVKNVIAICNELLAKIKEVIMHEELVTHEAGSRQQVSNEHGSGCFDQEKLIVRRLLLALKVQLGLFTEEWHPVIDRLDENTGDMEGHIQYRRI